MPNPPVLIIGGGLSGGLVAHRLAARGADFRLIEARGRLGGRILSRTLPGDTGSGAVDLGPSWFWPHQRAMIELIQSLGLESSVYEQSHRGASVIEYANGQLEQRAGAASMAGSYRIDGGMQTLIDQLVASVPSDRIQLNTRLINLQVRDSSVRAEIETAAGIDTVECESVVIALPPRVLAANVGGLKDKPFEGAALESVPTWMATEAKLTLVYDKPFWLDQGLSGDAFSQTGPLGEIHDATPRNSSRGALFGFVALRAHQRKDNAEQIKQQSIQQIQRLFNTSEDPIDIIYKDWSFDAYTASAADQTSQREHPSSSGIQTLRSDQKIIWAVSEAASHDAGYLEGAVTAAIQAVDYLTHK